MLGIYRVAAHLVASRVVLSSTELVSYGGGISRLLVGRLGGAAVRLKLRYNIKLDLKESG
jgi:hypothetical protein